MKIQELLAELGAHMGLANVQLDENGVCRLVFNNTISIDFEADSEDEDILIMHTVVGTVPAEGRLAYYQMLLGGNYLGSQTGDAVLALDAAQGEVVLWRRLQITDLTIEPFADALEALVKAAQEWVPVLSNFSDDSTPSLDSPSALPDFSGMIRI